MDQTTLMGIDYLFINCCLVIVCLISVVKNYIVTGKVLDDLSMFFMHFVGCISTINVFVFLGFTAKLSQVISPYPVLYNENLLLVYSQAWLIVTSVVFSAYYLYRAFQNFREYQEKLMKAGTKEGR